MPSVLPLGDPAPPDGLLPAAGGRGRGPAGLRALRAHPVLRGALRLLRLQHLHRHRARRRGLARTPTPAPPSRKWSSPPASWRTRACRPARSSTVFFGGGTPTLLPAEDLARICTRVDRRLGPAARRRGDHRGQPGFRHARVPAAAGRRRVHPGLVRHAVGRAARPEGPRPHPHAQPRARGGAVGAGRRPRGQPGPDLRHAGGVAGGLALLARDRAVLRARTTSAPTR